MEPKALLTVWPSGWAGLKSSSSTFGETSICYNRSHSHVVGDHLLPGVELLVGSEQDVLVAQLIDRHSSLASDNCVNPTNLAHIGIQSAKHSHKHTLLATSQAISKHHWLLSLGRNNY